MKILAIDPGPEECGIVFYDDKKKCVEFADVLPTLMVRETVRAKKAQEEIYYFDADVLVIEDIEPMGLAVGKSVFETCKEIGRLEEAWFQKTGQSAKLMGRGDVKIILCGCKTYVDPDTGKRRKVSDAEIRRAVMDRFPATGGGRTPVVGVKSNPGPLYGVKTHAWSALAIAVCMAETTNAKKS